MRLHGLLLTRDDADIIDECVAHALTWCDGLYVFDTGSSDDTWERINEHALVDHRVVPLRKCEPAVMMSSPLRAFVFNLVRDRFEEGDWWVQQDVDEFYHISPRNFIYERLRPTETAVYNQHFEFRITREEVERWRAGDDSVFDRSRPIADLRRHYNILIHSEPRMFRFRKAMQWGCRSAYPWNMGYVARERIPIRHYPHRDPLSLQTRLILRNHLLPLSQENWSHWAVTDWRHYVADEGDPDIKHWRPRSELPDIHDQTHIRSPLMRLAQRTIHQVLLPVFDFARPKYPRSFRPVVIPQAVNNAAVHDLSVIRAAGLASLRN